MKICIGALNFTEPPTDVDQVVVLADFDKMSRGALIPSENKQCNTSAEVLQAAGRKRLRCQTNV